MKKNTTKNTVTGVVNTVRIGSSFTTIENITGTLETNSEHSTIFNLASLDYDNIPTPANDLSILLGTKDKLYKFYGDAAFKFMEELSQSNCVNITRLIHDIVNKTVDNTPRRGKATIIYGDPQPSKTYGDKVVASFNAEPYTFSVNNTTFDSPVLPHNINKENSRGKRAALSIYDDAPTRETKHICSICNKPIDSCLDVFVFDDGDYLGDYLCRSCYDYITDDILGRLIVAGEREYIRLKNTIYSLYTQLCTVDRLLIKLKSVNHLSQITKQDLNLIIDTFNLNSITTDDARLVHKIIKLSPIETTLKTPKENKDVTEVTKVATPNVDDLMNDISKKRETNIERETNVATILLEALDKISALDGTPMDDTLAVIDQLTRGTRSLASWDMYDSLYKAIDYLSSYRDIKQALKAVANKLDTIKEMDNDLSNLNKVKGE